MDINPHRPVSNTPTDRPLYVLGLFAVVVSTLVGLEWTFVDLGVGLSGGPGSSTLGRRVSILLNVTVWSALAAVGVGVATIALAERRRPAHVRALLATASVAGSVLTVVAAVLLWTSATG